MCFKAKAHGGRGAKSENMGDSLSVIIDTNFAIFASEMRVDIGMELRRLFGTSYELVILPEVIRELRRLKRRVSLKLLGVSNEYNAPGSSPEEAGRSADDAIIEKVCEENGRGCTPVVCTMDAMLKKRLKENKLRFLLVVVRGKAQLSLV